MKIVCPKCSAAIPSDAVSVARGLAYFAPCGEAFSLAAFAQVPVRMDRPADAVTVLTPTGDR